MVSPVVISDLLNGSWENMEFTPFNDGIDVCYLLQGEPTVALLRYKPGARAPLHSHPALETILVLSGSQSDHRGTYKAGTLVLNPIGFEHAVSSDEGCVVLIQWNKPVRFLE